MSDTVGVPKFKPRKSNSLFNTSSRFKKKLKKIKKRGTKKRLKAANNNIKFLEGSIKKYGDDAFGIHSSKLKLNKKRKKDLSNTKLKKLTKSIGKGIGKGGVIGSLASLAMSYPQLKELIKGSVSDEKAKELLNKKNATAKEFRGNLVESFKNLPPGDIDSIIKDVALYSNPIGTFLGALGVTDNQVADATLDPVNLTTAQRKIYNKGIKKRKKGGRVGRPKGVGCAIRGHGKAMKRGK